MKKILAIIVIIIIVVLLGWLFVSDMSQPSQPVSLSSQPAASTTPPVGSTVTVAGVRVKIGAPFSIPATATGTTPIGTGQAWGTYTDAAAGFSFDYPSGIMDAYTKAADIKSIKSYLPINPAATLVLTLPPSQYPASTTVHQAAIVVAATTTPTFADCISAANAISQGVVTSGISVPTTTPTQISIVPPGAAPSSAPVNFYKFPDIYGGCWAGGCAFGTLIASYQHNTCYQFGLQAAVTDPGVYATSQQAFQKMNQINQRFETELTTLFYQILSTVQFQ